MTRSVVVVLTSSTTAAEAQGLVDAAAQLAAPAAPQVLRLVGGAGPVATSEQLAVHLGRSQAQRLVLLPTGTEGEALAAGLAALLDGQTLGRCTRLQLDGDAVLGHRTVFGGRAELALRSEAALTCATLRAGEAAPAGASPGLTELTIRDPQPLPTEPVPATGSLPRLEGARVVVSGGRGMGGPEGFDLLAQIARSLGGGFAGSLPTVDAGWVPVAHQVGISGRFVSPRVYFAVGISGTPQHLAGLAPQTRIVALNSDRDAPIFSRSDVGVVAQWQQVLPLLAQALQSG